MRFNPSSNKYSDLALQTLMNMFLQEQQANADVTRKKDLYTWEQGQKQAQALKMLQNAKDLGIFGEIGTDLSKTGTGVGQSAYIKGLDMETGMPQLGFRTPEEMQGMQFQNRIAGYKQAQQQGKGMTGDTFKSLDPQEKLQFIKSRETVKQGLPEFAGTQWKRNAKGEYQEIPSSAQAVVDPETGAIVFNKPKGAVFQPKKQSGGYTIDQARSMLGEDVPPGTTIKMGNLTVPLNPKLTQEQAASISAAQEVSDDVDSLKSLIKGGAAKSGGVAKSKLPYALIGGKPEEFKRIYDQLAARIPFAKGGKQLTPFEAKTLFALLPQIGQSEETIYKNLDKFVSEFNQMSQIAIKGTSGATGGFISPRRTGTDLQSTPKGNKFKVVQ